MTTQDVGYCRLSFLISEGWVSGRVQRLRHALAAALRGVGCWLWLAGAWRGEAQTPSVATVVHSRHTACPLRCAGDEATEAAPSEESEGAESERWVLPCDAVHGHLERAGCAARGRVPLTWRRGQVCGDLVRQRAPESWTGSAWLGSLYRKVVCVEVFKLKFRGINDSGHSKTPCPRMLPMSMGAASCGAHQALARHAASREGQSSNIISHIQYAS